MEKETCVYCKWTLSIKRALQRVPGQDYGWQCRSVRSCARRQASVR